jgi:hypothetical protein
MNDVSTQEFFWVLGTIVGAILVIVITVQLARGMRLGLVGVLELLGGIVLLTFGLINIL